MGFPAQLDDHDPHFPHDDSMQHFAAKELHIVLRIMVVLSIVATAVTMATFWMWAFLPVTVLLISYLGLLVTGSTESRTRGNRFADADRRAVEHAHEFDVPRTTDPRAVAKMRRRGEDASWIPMPMLKKEAVAGIEIVIGVCLAGIALAIIFLPAPLIITGAVLFALYMVLVMAPVWLGALGDFEEAEHSRLQAAVPDPNDAAPHTN
ncbi:MAG: hypothetical protein ACR2GY_05835 [Phycisphaerales bacterium]